MPKRKRSDRAETTINLPPEILEQIFLNLEFKDLLQARLTCHRWRDTIASCPELRDRFLVRFPHDRKIAKITRNYRPIAALKASNVEFKLTDYSKIGCIKVWWPEIASTVTSLALRGCEFPGDMLRYVVNLRSLELDCARIGWTKKVDFKLSNLRKLVINSSSPGMLSGMISKLNVLEYRIKVEDQGELCLIVELITSVRSTLEELIVDAPASYLQEFSLLDLRLKKVYVNAYWTRLTYCVEMVSFVRAIQSIEDLTIVDSLYDESLHATLQSQPGLKRLELKFVAPIVHYDDDAELNVLPLIPNVLPNLESLRINCVDDSGYPTLRFQQECRFPKLKNLYITSTFIKGESLRKILRYSPNLHSLYLYCDFQSWNQLLRLITQPKSLRSLTFGTFDPFKMTDVESISTKPCKTLQYLRIESNMSEVQEDFKNAQIIPLFRIFPHITKLHIEYGVNDELVKGICRNLTHLERLSMRNNSTTNRAILYIRQYGRKLKYLRLYGFWKVKVEDMHYFVQNLDHFGHAWYDFVGELRSIILDCIKLNEPMSDSDYD